MEKTTEKYLIDRIRELEEENKRYSVLNGELVVKNGQLIDTLATYEETITELKKYFKPELINRIDNINWNLSPGNFNTQFTGEE